MCSVARTSRPSSRVISVTPWRTLATFGAGRDPIWNENVWAYPNCMLFTFCCASQYQSQRLRNGSGSSRNSRVDRRQSETAGKDRGMIELAQQDSERLLPKTANAGGRQTCEN